MRGRAVIYIVDRMSGVSASMASVATAQLTLPYATPEMLSAILREIHKGKRRTKLPAGVDIGAMSELRLARVFAADSMSAAIEAITEFGVPDKTKPGITLDKVHGQPVAKAAFQQLLDDLNDWRKGSLDWSEVDLILHLSRPARNRKNDAVRGLCRFCRGELHPDKLLRLSALWPPR